ncbi:MAG TPA: YicC/YloC family endoribonuclease [Candidatus Kryptonia bacterium]
MIQSMTGFGKGESTVGGFTATAEVRSVNSRYLEVYVKLPQSLATKEIEVREMIRQRLGRGKVSLVVSSNNSRTDDQISVDIDSVSRIITLLKQLKKSAKITSPLKLEHLLVFKDLFKGSTEELSNGEEWEAVRGAVDSALAQLQEARTAEGQSLKNDLRARISRLNEAIDRIDKLARLRAEEGKAKLRQKVDEVMNGKEVDSSRLELEIVLLADKLDITEEVVRFRTHNEFFMKLLEGEDSNGRRLNFLLQEMNRETNTMGSKSFDVEMSHLVVEMKEELERIREQVQNLE